MKYLTISPDYTSSCVYDDFLGRIELDDLNLPENVKGSFSKWHEEYKAIIPLDEEERRKMEKKINELDKRGIELAHQLIENGGGNLKVKYYSEGLLKYLSI